MRTVLGSAASLCVVIAAGQHRHSFLQAGLPTRPKDAELASLLQPGATTAQNLALAALRAPLGSPTRELLHSLRICGRCDDFQRFGEQSDGGYLTCMDGIKDGGVTAALSIGVEHHDQWSEDVTTALGIKVFQFDCTVDHGSSCPQCKFFKKCLRSQDEKYDSFPGKSWTLAEALTNTEHGDAKDRSLIMKMDIEGSEWPILALEDESVLRKFKEIVVEFHWLDKEENHPQYLAAMRKLSGAGFRVAHIHGNNYNNLYKTGDDIIPNVIEVTLVSGGQNDSTCAIDAEKLPLDHPNNPEADDLPLAHLAF